MSDHTVYSQELRKSALGLMARAPAARVVELLDAAMTRPAFSWLRAPEVGSVMVRGRAGGRGEPFNLGEMTITRCSLRLESGEVGHAYVQGRRKADAEAVAMVDALLQTTHAPILHSEILKPLEQEMTAARKQRADKAAATKVDFFTLARGEDE